MSAWINGKRRWLVLTAGVLLAAVLLSGYFSPRKRIERYVDAHLETLEQDMYNYFEKGQYLRYDGGIRSVNHWYSTHHMVEYILFTSGGRYYGFYYSPDDVPLAFQNTPCALQREDEVWRWYGDGDNRGTTGRIRAQWFWFKASF